MISFGEHVRACREKRVDEDRSFSIRQVAQRVGIEPAYLSKIERGVFPPPSEDVIRKLAAELSEDPDVLLAMAGKVSSDLLNIILKRPKLFAEILRQMKKLPDHAVVRIVREIKGGDW
jgi:HTH-type transcriptional regulator, competence development regulator